MIPGAGSELRLRIISAVVLGSVVLVVTWYGGWPFRLLAGIAGVCIFIEWKSITSKSGAGRIGVAGLIIVASAAGAAVLVPILTPLPVVTIATIGATIGLALWEWFKNQRVWVSTGLVYALLPAFSLIFLRESQNGLVLVLLLFVIVWSTDIGAYFAGRAIGGPKLMPSVSPKKTWSGFFGGLMAAVIGTILLSRFADTQLVPVFLAGALSILSQIGDLFESWVKRYFKVKDSGNIIPGHGGIMDRVDGLIVAAVAFAVILAVQPV